MAQTVENSPAMQETQVSWVGEILWRREWLPIPAFLPGEFLSLPVFPGPYATSRVFSKIVTEVI